MHGPRPFTATGLGDRIHCCTVAWCYGLGMPVTLHLNAAHLTGGQHDNKPESWTEIVGLFPADAIRLRLHLRRYAGERAWAVDHGTVTWRYGDHPDATYPPDAVDVAPLLRDIPRLQAEPQDVALPPRFFTVQWDANGPARTVAPPMREALEQRYRAQGLEPVELGWGWTLKRAAYALSRAEFHLGADSAFMHLAQLYLPPERVWVYTRELTHHTRRLRARGGEVTLCS